MEGAHLKQADRLSVWGEACERPRMVHEKGRLTCGTKLPDVGRQARHQDGMHARRQNSA